MTNADYGLNLFFEMIDDEVVPEHTCEMTGDELRALDGKTVKFAPDDANYLGYYFDPYCDVMVYEKDGKYFKVYSYIGD